MFDIVGAWASNVVEELSGAIGCLGALDPGELDDDALHEAVVALGALSSRLEAAWCGLIHAWDQRGVWANNGSRSPAARLARETRMRQGAMKRLVTRGRQLDEMPLTGDAYAAGEISGDHVDLVASCNRNWRNADFVESEQLLVDTCRTPWFSNAVRAIDYWKLLADRDAADRDADVAREGRYLCVSAGWLGEVKLDGALDPVSGEIVRTELQRLCEELRLDDLRNGVTRTPRQRRADALVEMAKRSAAAPADGLRPRPLFTVLLGDDSFHHLCELADGTVIAPGLLVPLLADAEFERIVIDPPNRRFEASHRRTFVGALRRVIEVRDRHCQHESGCDVPAPQCDVDHIVPWSVSQHTCICNGRLLCKFHNRVCNDGRARLTKRQRTGDPLPLERDRGALWAVADTPTGTNGAPRSPPPG